jgi:hypothetical protein
LYGWFWLVTRGRRSVVVVFEQEKKPAQRLRGFVVVERNCLAFKFKLTKWSLGWLAGENGALVSWSKISKQRMTMKNSLGRRRQLARLLTSASGVDFLNLIPLQRTT